MLRMGFKKRICFLLLLLCFLFLSKYPCSLSISQIYISTLSFPTHSSYNKNNPQNIHFNSKITCTSTSNIKISKPFAHNILMQCKDSLTISPANSTNKHHFHFLHIFAPWFEITLTWVLGNVDVLKVSWVSSIILRLGMLSIKAAWSAVAAIDVILYPLSHLLCIPSLGYRKSSSTTYNQQG